MSDWIAEAKEWTGTTADHEAGSPLHTWDAFAAESSPTVTLFGAYDSGKSSLLRRILVDTGETVPDWLSISARHETFEAQVVDAAGCRIQDTPGIVLNPTDARAKQNTGKAMRAAALTDVLIVVLTPQLPTAELPAIRTIAGDRWCSGGLWFVISRFDEAGIDPEGDPEGYRDLTERKAAELRALLGSKPQSPIFVVSQDFAQLAGDDPDPDPDTWDDSRGWDGMDELAGALSALSDEPVSALRHDAELRFWHGVLAQRIENTNDELARLRTRREVTWEAVQRRDSWLRQLDALRDAAHASLDSGLKETARSLIYGKTLDPSRVQSEIEKTVNLWIQKQDQELMRLAQDVEVTWERFENRPGYRALEGFLSDLGGTTWGEPDDNQGPNYPRYTEKVDQLLGSLEPVLREIMEDRRKDMPSTRFVRSPKSRAGGKPSGVDAVQILVIARPFITEVAGIVEEAARARKQRELEQARQQELQGAIDRMSKNAAKLVSDVWEQHVAELQAEIERITAKHSVLMPELDKVTHGMQEALAVGEAILDRYPSCADD